MIPGTGSAQTLDGAQIFQQRCAACHDGAAGSRAPSPDALRARTPQSVIETLVTGSMRVQGSRMSGPERRAVAEFITAKALAGDVRGAERGRCAPQPSPPPAGGGWNGWSPTPANTRFQPSAHAGLDAERVRRLALKWAFGFPDASVAWAPASVVDGRIYVGSQNGTVYSLDAQSGCIHWAFTAGGGVRTGIPVADGRAFFGDTTGSVYAVDVVTGQRVWVQKVHDHPLARVTGSPVLHGGRLYVGVSSYEEAQGADPSYPCCTFRGTVVALDAASGRVVWRAYLMPEAERRGVSATGTPLWGPSGAGVWSAPTIDPVRRRLYVATGNAYTGPADRVGMSDAIVALDLETGGVVWSRQFTAGDVYLSNCRGANPNCPATIGPDFDFGSPAMLVTAAGRDLLVAAQKSGWAFAIDPADGREVWRYRAGQGGVLGGIEWGAAADDQRAYFAVSDITLPQPGGLHAVALDSGQRVWAAPPQPLACAAGRGCTAAQSAAISVIPGAVISGGNDGAIRAYSTADGSILWQFDTNREFATVNGVAGRGASIGAAGPVVAGGMLFISSGYGAFGGRPGNVLLAFGVE